MNEPVRPPGTPTMRDPRRPVAPSPPVNSQTGQDQPHGNLTKLGSATTYVYDGPDAKILETFDAPLPKVDGMTFREGNVNKAYLVIPKVELVFPEFTSLCPKTGQPDFATIRINYEPNFKCVETKSLKLYLFAFRNHGAFMEQIVSKIRDDLLMAMAPHNLLVTGEFNPRGGIALTAQAAGRVRIGKSAKPQEEDDEEVY